MKSCWDCDFAEFPPLEALTEADIVENEHHVPNLYSLSSVMDEWISKKEGQEGEGVNENYHSFFCYALCGLHCQLLYTKPKNATVYTEKLMIQIYCQKIHHLLFLDMIFLTNVKFLKNVE